MKKFVCTVCGYVYEGEAAPAECPICHAPADKFKEQTGETKFMSRAESEGTSLMISRNPSIPPYRSKAAK